MRKRFVPGHYHRDLHQKIRKLAQGNRSVEDYFQEMETLMMKIDIDEDPEATMSRFLGSLNKEIHDRLEMQDYETMEEMLHKANLVEKQLKRSGSSCNAFGVKTSSMRTSYPKEEQQPKFDKPLTIQQEKGKVESSFTRNRDIQCFKCQGKAHMAKECPNRRAMVIMANGEIRTEDEKDSSSDSSEEIMIKAPEDDLLVARKVLNLQVEPEENEQRDNLFHTRWCKERFVVLP